MLNSCNFIGRVGKDPELRHTQGGSPVVSFSMACSESWKDKVGQKQEKTEWINCVAWGKLAEIIGEYVNKGDLLFVSGKFTTRKWDDKDGNTRYSSEIVVSEMKMLGGKGRQEDAPAGYEHPAMGEDVPF